MVGSNSRCIFDEAFSPEKNFYSVMRNMYNSTWHVGFDRKGRPLLGSKYLEDKRCFQFLKRTDIGIKDFHKHRHHGPKINPMKLSHLLLERLNRKRRWLSTRSR